jgi:hypothetical protein
MPRDAQVRSARLQVMLYKVGGRGCDRQASWCLVTAGWPASLAHCAAAATPRRR